MGVTEMQIAGRAGRESRDNGHGAGTESSWNFDNGTGAGEWARGMGGKAFSAL